jgi:hypothetical protein
MKWLAIAIGVGMAVFTAVSIAFADTWSFKVIAYVGPVDVSTFDLLFFGAIAIFVVANAIRIEPERIPANRLVLGLCWAYLGYQLLVVFPAAVLLHDLRPIDVVRLQEVRLSLVLIPITYSVVLRYVRASTLVAIVDAAAIGLAIWVLFMYFTQGPHGYMESGVFRLRAVWGGGILLFGWLLLTSLFYWPTRAWRLLLAGLALAGIALANQRSGLLACVTSFATASLIMRGVAKRALIALVLVMVVSVAFYFGSSPQVRQSVAYSVETAVRPSSDQTAQDRLIRSALGLAYLEQHPLGDYVWTREFYAVNLGASDFVPHNFVVQLLVTQGVVASALYFALIGAAVFMAWRNRNDHLSGLMLAYLVFYLTFCLLNANIDLRENVSLFYIAVALILQANRSLALEAEPAVLELGEALGAPSGAAVAGRGSRA